MKVAHRLFLFILCFPFLVNAQDTTAIKRKSKFYLTSSGEFIFSWANVDNNGVKGGVITRFSAYLHLQSLINRDFNESIGVFSGMAMRNVGFIYDDPEDSQIRRKFRTYNVGIPVGLKLGNMNGRLLYLGYELEIPFNYKEKTFINENKEDKFHVWFSDRTPTVYHSVFFGINDKSGVGLKFKYYLTEFFNRDFTLSEDGVTTKPFADLKVNVFYVSLNMNLFGTRKLRREHSRKTSTSL